MTIGNVTYLPLGKAAFDLARLEESGEKQAVANWLDRGSAATPCLKFEALADCGKGMREFIGVDEDGEFVEIE